MQYEIQQKLFIPLQKHHPDLASLHAQSAGEDSNSSDTEPSDRGDGQMDATMDSLNGSLDNQRSHSFPNAFLGLQGIPGLLPGPSGIHGANDFGEFTFYHYHFSYISLFPVSLLIIKNVHIQTILQYNQLHNTARNI